jgi:hypothetical protein
MYMAFGSITFQPTNELKVMAGEEFSYWTEANRNGTAPTQPTCKLVSGTWSCTEGGFYDTNTRRSTTRVGLSYAFGGALFTYTLEYFHKNLFRDPTAYYDMVWNVWRSKATFEVSW